MTAKTHHVAALALSLAVTLGLFSSVAGLSAPSHGGQFLVQAKVVAPQA
jgi:short subunit fatty acids transporter